MSAESVHVVRLSGVFAPICTPFKGERQEQVDFAALESNMSFYAQSGLQGIVALGSNGENPYLNGFERLAVLRMISANRGRDQIVIAGVMEESRLSAGRLLRQFSENDADYGLVLPPSFFAKQMTETVLYEYFMGLADESPLPLVLYNAPKFCRVVLKPELVVCLSVHPNIVGIKDSGGLESVLAILNLVGTDFAVGAGSGSYLLPAMMAGAIGGVVSLANSFPEIALELFQCGLERNKGKGEVLQEKAKRLGTATSGTYGVPGVKAAMDLRGLKGGDPRLPLKPLAEADKKAMREILVAEGVL